MNINNIENGDENFFPTGFEDDEKYLREVARQLNQIGTIGNYARCFANEIQNEDGETLCDIPVLVRIIPEGESANHKIVAILDKYNNSADEKNQNGTCVFDPSVIPSDPFATEIAKAFIDAAIIIGFTLFDSEVNKKIEISPPSFWTNKPTPF